MERFRAHNVDNQEGDLISVPSFIADSILIDPITSRFRADITKSSAIFEVLTFLSQKYISSLSILSKSFYDKIIPSFIFKMPVANPP